MGAQSRPWSSSLRGPGPFGAGHRFHLCVKIRVELPLGRDTGSYQSVARGKPLVFPCLKYKAWPVDTGRDKIGIEVKNIPS
jgi:hypothetical protein